MKMSSEDFSNMINWDNFMQQSDDFKNKEPFNFSFDHSNSSSFNKDINSFSD